MTQVARVDDRDLVSRPLYQGCYIKDYERVKVLLGNGLRVSEMDHAIGRGQRTVHQYGKIVLEFRPDLIPPTQEGDR